MIDSPRDVQYTVDLACGASMPVSGYLAIEYKTSIQLVSACACIKFIPHHLVAHIGADVMIIIIIQK